MYCVSLTQIPLTMVLALQQVTRDRKGAECVEDCALWVLVKLRCVTHCHINNN